VQEQAAEDVRQLGGRSPHQRERRHVRLDAHSRGVRLRPGHLHGSGEHRGQVERIAGAVAAPAGEVLQPRDDAGGVPHHPAEHIERAPRPGELRIGAQRGHPQGDDVERVVEVVRHAGGQHAHGVHALLVEQGLALLLHFALPAELGADVVDQRHRLSVREPLQPDLHHLAAPLEAGEAGRGRQGRRLGVQELAQAVVADARVGAAHPAPGPPARVQGGVAGVRLADPPVADHGDCGAARRVSPSRERIARIRGHAGMCVA
jgi:hypothetical protein